jgi:hypothetical protein
MLFCSLTLPGKPGQFLDAISPAIYAFNAVRTVLDTDVMVAGLRSSAGAFEAASSRRLEQAF